MTLNFSYVTPVLLLMASNVFMTMAWYGHLRHKGVSLGLVVLVSWMIALPEYMLAVPANRIGHGVYTAVQLKTIQEVVTLTVFVAFSILYLGESVRWNHMLGFALIATAAFLIFME